jgi:methyl-accepting chemotaxis protein
LAQKRHNLLLDLPIAGRLALGFLLAALIAASASALSGIQRAQSLNREADFYQSLLTTNTNLNNGGSFLQLMKAETQSMLIDASATAPSAETLKQDQDAINNLITLYDNVTGDYLKNRQLYQHPDQMSLLTDTGRSSLVTQQRILGASMSRTWQVYRAALGQVLADVARGDVATAQIHVRAQAEPTNTDALSALRAVIQFDGRLAGSVHAAADLDQRDQALTTVGVAFVAFLLIALVGWIISNTLVSRLRLLRKVAESVERGEVSARVAVIGTDEIGRVSGSVNGMLDTIVGLLDVTRRQRDALHDAATRLFADVRIAGTGDLRVNAAVGSDPIGMLANAFNFTINRFRRFVMRTQFSLDQLDMNSRQALQRAETFHIATQALLRGQSYSRNAFVYPYPSDARENRHQMLAGDYPVERSGDVTLHISQARDLIGRIAREGVNHHSRVVLDLAEQAYLSAGRLSQLALTAYNVGSHGVTAEVTNAQMDELRALGELLSRLGTAANAIQKNTTASLRELDSELTAIDEAWSVAVTPGSAPLGESQQTVGGYSIDVLKLSNEFADEVVALARQSMTLTLEMRAHMAPFRLDQVPNGDMDLPMYTPGTR